MAHGIDIIVFGNGSMFALLFNAIAACMNGAVYKDLLRMTSCVVAVLLMIQYSQSRQILLFSKYFMTCFLLFHLLFTPKVAVVIDDKISDLQYAVAHVPIGLAMMAHVSTHVGAALTDIMESNFSLPDDLRYNRSGYIMAGSLMHNATQFQSVDPTFQANLASFMKQCVFYDLYLKKYTLKALIHSDDVWAFLNSHKPSPARLFRYRASGDDTVPNKNEAVPASDDSEKKGDNDALISCREGMQRFQQQWGTVTTSSAHAYTHWLHADSKKADTGRLITALGASYQYLLGVSTQADKIMQQVILANAFRDAAAYGGLPGAHSSVARYAFSKADAQKQLTSVTVGMLAYKYLPVAKNCLACLLFAGFIFVFFMALLPGKARHMRDYFLLLLWIEFWPPIYALLNFMMTAYAQHQLSNIADPLSLSALGSLSAESGDIAALAGYMSLSVPMLSWYFVKFSEFTITQFAGQMGGLLQGAASGAANEAISGNLSMGNTHFANHSAFNTSAFQTNTSASLNMGSLSKESIFGSKMQYTPSGQTRLPLFVKPNITDAVSSSLGHAADRHASLAESESNTVSKSISSVLGNTLSLADQYNASTSSGETFSATHSASHQQVLSQLHNVVSRAAQHHSVSESDLKSYLVQLSASAHAGSPNLMKVLSGAIDARLSGDRGHSTQESHLAQAAKEVVHSLQSNDVLDESVRAARTGQYHTQDAKSQQYAKNISESYKEAQNAMQQRTENLQKAQQLREQAQFVSIHSGSVSSDLSQPFLNWLATQEDPAHPGEKYSSERLDAMQYNDPSQLQALAQQYISSFGEDALSKKVAALQKITGKNIDDGIGNLDTSSVNNQHQRAAHQIGSEAAGRGIDPHQISLYHKNETNQTMQNINTEHDKKHNSLTNQVQKEKQNIASEIKRGHKKIHSWNPFSWF